MTKTGPGVAAARGLRALVARGTRPLKRKEKLAIPEGPEPVTGVGVGSRTTPKSSKVLQATLGLVGSAPVCGGAAAKPIGACRSTVLVACAPTLLEGVLAGVTPLQLTVSTVARN